MGNKPIKHHIAPETYLNNFAALGEGQKSLRLSVLSRKTGEIESRVKTRNIFYKHFYDHIGDNGQLYGSAEKPLNNRVEVPGNKVIADLLDGKGLKYVQVRDLARYLLIAVYRSLWFHIGLRAFLVEHAKYHSYQVAKVPELTHRKQVELLRAFMGLPTDSPNVYLEDALLSQMFNSVSSPSIEDGKKTVETLVRAHLQYRNLIVFSAPQGTEFITADNHVIPLLSESVDNFLDIPIHNLTEFLMPLNPQKVLFVSGRIKDLPGVNLSRKMLPASDIKNINDTICTFSSAHIFSKNEKLLHEVHSRQPFQEGKIVVIGDKEMSYFPHPTDLPQKFGTRRRDQLTSRDR